MPQALLLEVTFADLMLPATSGVVRTSPRDAFASGFPALEALHLNRVEWMVEDDRCMFQHRLPWKQPVLLTDDDRVADGSRRRFIHDTTASFVVLCVVYVEN